MEEVTTNGKGCRPMSQPQKVILRGIKIHDGLPYLSWTMVLFLSFEFYVGEFLNKLNLALTVQIWKTCSQDCLASMIIIGNIFSTVTFAPKPFVVVCFDLLMSFANY